MIRGVVPISNWLGYENATGCAAAGRSLLLDRRNVKMRRTVFPPQADENFEDRIARSTDLLNSGIGRAGRPGDAGMTASIAIEFNVPSGPSRTAVVTVAEMRADSAIGGYVGTSSRSTHAMSPDVSLTGA